VIYDILEAQSQKLNEEQQYICKEHATKQFKLFCQKDKSFICEECLLESHIGHDIIPAKPFLNAEFVRKKLAETQPKIKSLGETSA
jgi:hypothetical protein